MAFPDRRLLGNLLYAIEDLTTDASFGKQRARWNRSPDECGWMRRNFRHRKMPDRQQRFASSESGFPIRRM